MKRKHFLVGFAVLSIAAMFMLAGCEKPTDPVTGKELLTGSLEVKNEYANNPISAVYVDSSSGERVWTCPSGTHIAYGDSKIFNDIPEGTWKVTAGGSTVNDVVIVNGMVTRVTRDSSGNAIKGEPMPIPMP